VSRELNRRIFLSRSAAAAAGAVTLTALRARSAGAATANGSPASTGYAKPVFVPDVPVRPEALSDPTEPTVAEAITLLRQRKLTATDLVDAHLDHIDKFDSVYQAFNAVTADAARAAAQEADLRPGRARSAASRCVSRTTTTPPPSPPRRTRSSSRTSCRRTTPRPTRG
jgi:hypothetical protein